MATALSGDIPLICISCLANTSLTVITYHTTDLRLLVKNVLNECNFPLCWSRSLCAMTGGGPTELSTFACALRAGTDRSGYLCDKKKAIAGAATPFAKRNKKQPSGEERKNELLFSVLNLSSYLKPVKAALSPFTSNFPGLGRSTKNTNLNAYGGSFSASSTLLGQILVQGSWCYYLQTLLVKSARPNDTTANV